MICSSSACLRRERKMIVN
ncbi:hypothetical protein Zm00014a_018131 [Zea mays]|uniref:Uncharacterized protein n=1 Tax=Zea mays TaxID=4577 RepID=A0A3L6ECG7_MAIZE|nr:hypothetical protein Zm00014a_018131 [Zea mays]